MDVEPSVQMRLYTLNKRHFALVSILCIVCLSIVILIGVLGPPVMEYSIRNASSLSPIPQSRLVGPFIIKSPPVSSFHQQLWLTARVIVDKAETFSLPLNVAVLLRGMADDDRTRDIVYNNRAQNHSRHLYCTASACDDIIVLHLGYLSYPAYMVTMYMYGMDAVKYPVTDIQFTFTMYNASFTQLEIWLRFSFVVLTLIITCAFAHSLRKFSIRDWSIEQKWMSFTLPLLILYNNPFLPLMFLVNSYVPAVVDIVFQTTFTSALLLYWMCIYHGVRQPKRRFCSFYLPKLLLVGLFWVAIASVLSWQCFQQLTNPMYDYSLDSANYGGYKIYMCIVASIYVLYLLYLMIRAYVELRSTSYFDVRLKFMTALLLVVISVGLIISGLRFCLAPSYDNFVAELAIRFHSSVEFSAFYGLVNIYVFTLAFVYAPSANAIYESHFQDNPAMSMMNESDEDVVYGEDASLTRTNSSVNKYDSDEEAFN